MNVKNEKPPMGVAPFFIEDEKRMLELAECIERHVDYTIRASINREDAIEEYKHIALWAEELRQKAEGQIDLIQKREYLFERK